MTKHDDEIPNQDDLSTATDEEITRFKRQLSDAGLTATTLREIIRRPGMPAFLMDALKRHPIFALIHKRFHTLDGKVAIVQDWPGMNDVFSEADFRQAVEEAHDTNLVAAFQAASLNNEFLDIVLSVYLDDPVQTFRYGRDRLRDVFHNRFTQFDEAFEDGLEERLSLIADVPHPKNRLKVEVVDLGTHLDRERGVKPLAHANAKAAHASVLYAVAQDPDIVDEMGTGSDSFPYLLMGGYRVTVPRFSSTPSIPAIWFDPSIKKTRLLTRDPHDTPRPAIMQNPKWAGHGRGFLDYSLPTLWSPP